MQERTRIGILVEPFLARTAIHAALSGDERVDVVLFPEGALGQLQARTAEVDALIVSHDVIRPDLVVARLSPAGSVHVLTGDIARDYAYTDLPGLVDLVLSHLARARHPSTVRRPRLLAAAAP